METPDKKPQGPRSPASSHEADSYPPVPDAFEPVGSFLEDLQEFMSQFCRGDTKPGRMVRGGQASPKSIRATPYLLMNGATDEMELLQEGKY